MLEEKLSNDGTNLLLEEDDDHDWEGSLGVKVGGCYD